MTETEEVLKDCLVVLKMKGFTKEEADRILCEQIATKILPNLGEQET